MEVAEEGGALWKSLLEASGGINEENLLEYASTGVNVISIGAVTHSVKAIDISLEITHSEPKA